MPFCFNTEVKIRHTLRALAPPPSTWSRTRCAWSWRRMRERPARGHLWGHGSRDQARAAWWPRHALPHWCLWKRYHTGVCEKKTHPTCGQCRTPPIPPNVKVSGHAQGECNRSVKSTLVFVSCRWASFGQLWNKGSGVGTLKTPAPLRWVFISQTPTYLGPPTVCQSCRRKGVGRQGIGSCCKEFLRFSTTPCRPTPFFVHFWIE